MLAPNDARITGLRCVEPGTGSTAGAFAAGSALMMVMSVEAGAALFATGARFRAGAQVEGLEVGPAGTREGWLGDIDWPSPVAELRLLIPGGTTAHLADRLLAVAGFLRLNGAPPYLVSALRGPDIFIVPAAAASVASETPFRSASSPAPSSDREGLDEAVAIRSPVSGP
jgi:hypothetical protein